jgi:serine/threonine protein phosphatase PrpC
MAKKNQDRCLIKKENLCGLENLSMVAVCDGHGTNGHFIAKLVKKHLSQVLEFEDKRMVKG